MYICRCCYEEHITKSNLCHCKRCNTNICIKCRIIKFSKKKSIFSCGVCKWNKN